MELTDKEKWLIITSLKKQIEDKELLLMDMRDNQIRNRVHTRVMELHRLVNKLKNDVEAI